MKKKKGFSGGFFQGMNMQARLGEAAFLSLLIEYKEAKTYIGDGYETWEDFCLEEIGVSDDTMRRRFKALETFGPETTRAMINLGMSWKDVRAIDNVLTEDQRTQLKKGVLMLDGKKIPVTEDRAMELQSAVDLLIARADAAVKGEKLAKHKLEGIEKEHRKEVKAMNEEVASLRAMLPKDDDDTEWAEKFIADIEQKASAFDLTLRAFAFRKNLYKDPALQSKVIGMNERIKALFEQFERDFDALIMEGEE